MPMVSEHLCFTRSCIAIFSSNAQHFDLCAVKAHSTLSAGSKLFLAPILDAIFSMIVCAAVLGQTNNPLYLEVFQSKGKQEDALKFHYIVHCALDAVEEKVAAPRKAPGEVFDTYLGMLYPTEDFKVYGYISNTRIKFMLVVDEMLQKEDEMRMMFKRFHTAYVDAVSNPFYTTSTSVTSKRFDASVRTMVTSLGAS